MAHHHSTKNLKVAFFLNLAFTIIEFVGGVITGSLAILSDAIHDLGDSLSLGMSWYFQNLSEKKSNSIYSYGYKRFSLLGAIINAIVLLVGSVLMISHAVPQVFQAGKVNEKGMLIMAVFGVIVNGIAALRLHKGKTMNEKVIALHLLEDVLGWVAVLVGSLLIMYFDWYFIDPLLSVLIALFIIYNVFKNLKKSFKIILQATPEEIPMDKIEKSLLNLAEVIEVHDCHIWSMDGDYHVFSAHLVLDQPYNLHELANIKQKAKVLLEEMNISHATLEFEERGEIH